MVIPKREIIFGEEVLITEELFREMQEAYDLYTKAKQVDTSQLTVDDLVDMRDVVIDRTKTKFERTISYLIQVKNPYCVRVEDTKVRMSFPDIERTLDDVISGMAELIYDELK